MDKKSCGTFTQWNTNGILALKKDILPFVTAWMELENIMLNEISPSGKDKYHMISLIKAQIWTTVWELTVRVEGGIGGRGQWGKIGTTTIDKNKK